MGMVWLINAIILDDSIPTFHKVSVHLLGATRPSLWIGLQPRPKRSDDGLDVNVSLVVQPLLFDVYRGSYTIGEVEGMVRDDLVQ